MRFIFSYVKKYWHLVALGMCIKLLGTCLELTLPYILEHMIDTVVPQKSLSAILLWGALMVCAAIACRICNVKANRFSVRVARESIYEIREDLFARSINLSGEQLDGFGLPSLTSRMTSDSYNVQSFIQSFQTLGVRAPILLMGGIAITMTMDVGLSAILCVIAPILITTVVFISRKGIPLYDKVQKSLDEIVRTMRENITGIRVVKALSKEDYEKRRFHGANSEMAKREIAASVVMSLPGPIMGLALNSGLTLVVIIGAIRVNNGQTEPGVILAFLTYFNMILMGIMGLNRIFMMMSKANASANRIAEVVATEDGLTPVAEEDALHTDKEDYIVFDHVDFSYGGQIAEGSGREKCLTDIDFTMKKGSSLGIIGPTGCGKTTIINLLMRFYDATEGGVFLEGRDVRSYEKDELHRKFGVVFQNDVIFADTLRENIEFGRQVSEKDLIAAAQDARAYEFIEQYEDDFDHLASIHGANLSGGQRQRVLISRALAADPEILILDDSSSALDYKTDAMLRKAIREHHKDTTTIVIAQRISSIMNLDDIIVLEEGRIIGHGKHEELLAGCPAYAEIFRTQMGEVK